MWVGRLVSAVKHLGTQNQVHHFQVEERDYRLKDPISGGIRSERQGWYRRGVGYRVGNRRRTAAHVWVVNVRM